MNSAEWNRMYAAVLDLKNKVDALPNANIDDGNALFAASYPLIDAACNIQCELLRIWSERPRPATQPRVAPGVSATADDLLI